MTTLVRPGLIDQAATVHAGEVLDAARLETYLLAHLPGASGPLGCYHIPPRLLPI